MKAPARMMIGGLVALVLSALVLASGRSAEVAIPDSLAIQPECRPMTSTTMTRSCERAVVRRRSMFSVAIWTADQKPKV